MLIFFEALFNLKMGNSITGAIVYQQILIMLIFEFLYRLRLNLNVGLSFKQRGKDLSINFNVTF